MDVNNEVLNIDATGSTDMQTPVIEAPAVVQHDVFAQDADALPAVIPDQNDMTSRTVEPNTTTHRGPLISLYESFNGTIIAVILGLGIIIGIQTVVSRIFSSSKSMSDSPTTFATSMVANVVGIYCCDMLIAGPATALLGMAERTTIVTFIKDISLMCFSYYFGSKTSGVSTPPEV